MYANPKSQETLMNGCYFKSFKKTLANMFSVENYALNWEEKKLKKKYIQYALNQIRLCG